MEIQTVEVQTRNCGTRQQGGYYFVGDIPLEAHSFFPKPLTCACGHRVIRPSRSAQAFYPGELWKRLQDEDNPFIHFPEDKKAWAMTIDVRNYPTVFSYINEGQNQGISRRLNNGLPKGFKVGEDKVFLIHQKAWKGKAGELEPGFFMVFTPKECQYVCHGEETPQFIEELRRKGITPINVPGSRPPKTQK